MGLLHRHYYNLQRERRHFSAKAEALATYSLRLSISEGKYHQVKRMLAAVGNKVVELHREQIGNIILDENLASGEYRQLTEGEV